jgi:hypothetical protein
MYRTDLEPRAPFRRDDEGALRAEVPRECYPEHACQELASVHRRNHEPTLRDAATRPPHACATVPAVHSVHNVCCFNVPLCQVLKAGRCKD